MAAGREARPDLQINIAVEMKDASGQGVLVLVHKHDEFTASRLGQLRPAQKSGGGPSPPVVQGPCSHEAIHRVGAHTRIRVPITKSRSGAVGGAFEYKMSLNVRRKRPGALADEIAYVCPVNVAVNDVPQSPTR